MHRSIVTNNVRAGSLVLIQSVLKGNNDCVLFYSIFSLRWHFALGWKEGGLLLILWTFLVSLGCGTLSPGSARATEPGVGETQKSPSRKCKRALKTCTKRYFGKTPKNFAPFPVSSPSSGKHECVYGAVSVFFWWPGCHSWCCSATSRWPGRTRAACAKHSEPALNSEPPLSKCTTLLTDKQKGLGFVFSLQLPSYVTGELMWHLHGSALRGEPSLYK